MTPWSWAFRHSARARFPRDYYCAQPGCARVLRDQDRRPLCPRHRVPMQPARLEPRRR